MPNSGPVEITVSSTYFPSQNPTTATKSNGVKFIPPSGGCTICSDKDLGGTKKNHITEATHYSLEQFTVGEKITYSLCSYETECPCPDLKANTGNSIIIGSGLPK